MNLINKIRTKFLFIKNLFYKEFLNQRFGTFKIDHGKYELQIFDEFMSHNKELWSINNNTNYSSSNVIFTNNGLLLNNNNVKGSSIKSIHTLKNGIYEFNVELPLGTNNESIIKLKSSHNLPELILLKSVSDDNGKYNNNICSNIIYGIYGLHKNTVGPTRSITFNENEIRYMYINIKLVMTNYEIRVYHNNFCINIITDKNILKYFKNKKYYIEIINNKSTNINYSYLKVKNFSFYTK